MAKMKHAKGVRIENTKNGGCCYISETKEAYPISEYHLMWENENGKWRKYDYSNEPEDGVVYYIIYQGNKSQGVVKDIHGKKVSMKNVILMWRFESGDMEGIFLQRATDTKKMMNVLTWEGVYTQPEISKKMIRGLLMLFSNEIFGRNIQDVFNEFPKIVEMSPKVEANSENE